MCNQPLVRKKWNKHFKLRKVLQIFYKLIINEFGRCLTRSDNVYFAKNEQAALAVFTVVFYFTHAEHDLIKLNI